MKRIEWMTPTLLLAVLALPLGGGCGNPKSNTASSESTSAQPESVNEPPPKTAMIVEDGVGTEPAQCVGIFLDSLRRGDEVAANKVLTQLARDELAKTDYVIQPLGTPEGQFKIGRVGFPYKERNVALVECEWIEPAADGQEQIAMEIVCEVHQESNGWRIAGIGVTIPGTDEAVVLDFEDAVSLQATIDAATGQSSAPQQVPTADLRVAAARDLGALPASYAPMPSGSQTALPSNLPDLPSLGGQVDESDIAPPTGSPPNIALPPSYDQTNR